MDQEGELNSLKEKITALEAELAQHRGLSPEIAFRLPGKLSDLLKRLMAQPSVHSNDTHKETVNRLRKAMKPFNVTIHSKRNLGYWINQTDKQHIRNLLKQTLQVSSEHSIKQEATPLQCVA